MNGAAVAGSCVADSRERLLPSTVVSSVAEPSVAVVAGYSYAPSPSTPSHSALSCADSAAVAAAEGTLSEIPH